MSFRLPLNIRLPRRIIPENMEEQPLVVIQTPEVVNIFTFPHGDIVFCGDPAKVHRSGNDEGEIKNPGHFIH